MTDQERAEKRAEQKLLREQMARIRTQARKQGRRLTTGEQDLLDEAEDHIQGLQSQLDGDSGRRNARTLPGNGARIGQPGSGFQSFGEQMQSVMRAGIPGGQVDQRLYDAATGASETVPSEGGFLVQQDFSPELLQGSRYESEVWKRCRFIPVSQNSNGTVWPGVDESSRADGSRGGGILSYWADEAEEKTGSKPKFKKIELSLKKLVGLCYATDEVLEDAATLEAYIRQGFADEFAFKVDDAIIRGTGAGQPLGILNAGCLVTVDKEAGQAAATVQYENILAMWSRMSARSRRRAVWYINQDVEPQLYRMSLTVGTGGSAVYLPGGGASEAPYSTLLGRPVIPIEQCETLGTAGDIILADPAEYLLCEKGGIKADMSIHVRFIYDESVFRFVLRIDGQPAWSAPMTPYKGSNTLSPFVTLASRA